MKFDAEAKRFVFVFLIIALFCAMTKSVIGYVLSGVFVFLALFSLYFFRDPDRQAPDEEGSILSPADGVVAAVGEKNIEGLGQCHRVGIFMSVLNVHVNRAPIKSTVKTLEYREGSFKHAGTEEAFENNEQMIIDLEGEDLSIRVIQIAGMVARRVVCRLKVDQGLERGERIGLIRFGSRLEVFIPKDKAEIKVKRGDRVICGQSVIARKD